VRRLGLFFHKMIRYGLPVAFWDILDSQKKWIGIFPDKINEKKHTAIITWLTKKFQYLISDFAGRFAEFILPQEGVILKHIWICWWDGIGSMPPIVKACYNSVLKYSGDYTVHLITRDNFGDFISIPEHVLEKVNAGTMTVTHFSDIIRMSLLAKHGGLWLDATILVTDTVQLEDMPFFTIKWEYGGEDAPKRRWTGNCIGGIKNNILFEFVREFLCEYWEKYDEMIDYFLYDYTIAVAYHSIPQIQRMIDNVRISDQQFYALQDNLEKEVNVDFLNGVCKDTIFHKLTWKKNYPAVSAGNKPTLYGYIMDRYAE
jgi:hypothetical protein